MQCIRDIVSGHSQNLSHVWKSKFVLRLQACRSYSFFNVLNCTGPLKYKIFGSTRDGIANRITKSIKVFSAETQNLHRFIKSYISIYIGYIINVENIWPSRKIWISQLSVPSIIIYNIEVSPVSRGDRDTSVYLSADFRH